MSFFFEIVRLGLHNLRLHKLRSVLTSLGIILGVAAVIVMVAIGEGRKIAALREIEALGATNIILRSVKPPESANISSQSRSFVVSYGLLRRDLRQLEAFFPDLQAIVPLKAVGDEISYGSQREVSQTFGITPELLKVTSLRLERGRYITAEDMQAEAPVAVIGSEVAKKFFRLEDPIGRDFRIGNRVFSVVGVLKPVGLAGGSGSALVGRDLNKDVHIPLTTAAALFGDMVFRRQSGSFSGENVELSEIYLTARNTDVVLDAAARIKRLVDVNHAALGDVQIIVPWELLEQQKRLTRQMNMLLTVIASVSLLIGGIGIMNIMLASVTERTREIGIRRALGATRKHIVAQFLVETGTLSTLGGLIGIAFGVGAALIAEYGVPWLSTETFLSRWVESQREFETQITTWSIVVSFIVAALVGLIFGIYPAIVASRKDPIVALRHD